MGRKYLLLVVSILGGIAGIFLRRWQLTTSFELSTGLPIAGTTATLVIALLTVVVALLLLLISLSIRKQAVSTLPYADTFRAHSFFYLLMVWAAALITAAAAGLHYRESLAQPQTNFLQLFFSLLTICAAVSLILIGKSHYQGKDLKGSLLLLMPAYSICIWLMVSYQHWARDPFVLDYVFALLAIIASMLAHYYIASYSFHKPRPTSVFISGMLAVYFSLIALAGNAALSDKCLFAAQILYFIPTIFILCRNHGAELTGSPDTDSDHPLKEETP
ncbi:MAG: hypothetical protein K0S60_193 [Evtepia sp.]|jgi:hypothetical protein|nr:hypothetical protein [Evtepia sp.]